MEASPEMARDKFDVLVIPAGLTANGTLPVERIEDYTGHLRKMIREAASPPDDKSERFARKMRERAEHSEARFAVKPLLRDYSDRICGICKGGCCSAGGNAAFIDSATIRRIMKQQPDLSDEDILQLYLSKLSTETISGACINQAISGCTLPREMRSDTCNGFFCDPLDKWQGRPEEERPDNILAIQRSESYWNRLDLKLPNQITGVTLVRADISIQLPLDLTV